MVLSYWEREAFYSPMIRTHFFSEPIPLDCEIHKSHFFLSLQWKEWLTWTGVRHFPSSGQLGYDNTSAI